MVLIVNQRVTPLGVSDPMLHARRSHEAVDPVGA